MKRIIYFVIMFALIVSLLCIQTPCFAQNMLRKLGRGTANIVTSIIEVPKSVQKVFYDDGPAAAATYGVVDGVFKCLLRTVVGVYEVITFPFPFPADYAPIVEPEFLFSAEE